MPRGRLFFVKKRNDERCVTFGDEKESRLRATVCGSTARLVPTDVAAFAPPRRRRRRGGAPLTHSENFAKAVDKIGEILYYCISEVLQLGGELMEWKLNKDRPLSPQLYELICVSIASGKLSPDEKVMSVREAAVAAGVNPNTVQRAFETLERDGILYSVRGSGWFVASDISKARDVLKRLIHGKTQEYFMNMSLLGLDAEATKNYVKEWEI